MGTSQGKLGRFLALLFWLTVILLCCLTVSPMNGLMYLAIIQSYEAIEDLFGDDTLPR